MLTGVTSTTSSNLQLGAGVLTKAYTQGGSISAADIIGASRGGGSFTAVPTQRGIEADGLPSNVKNFKVIDEWVATLNITLIEFKADVLKLALGGGATSTTSADTTTITATDNVVAADFQDLYWIGDLSDGNKIVIHLKNAMNSNGLNITITNKGEGTFALALVANYDVSDLSTAPFEIIR